MIIAVCLLRLAQEHQTENQIQTVQPTFYLMKKSFCGPILFGQRPMHFKTTILRVKFGGLMIFRISEFRLRGIHKQNMSKEKEPEVTWNIQGFRP